VIEASADIRDRDTDVLLGLADQHFATVDGYHAHGPLAQFRMWPHGAYAAKTRAWPNCVSGSSIAIGWTVPVETLW
jgi:hypothetical protein